MKILSIFLLFTLCAIRVNSQSKLPLRADTVTVEKIGGVANFQVKDVTKDTVGGVYTNIGNGVLRAKKSRKISDSSFTVGGDTIIIRLPAVGNTIYTGDGELIGDRHISGGANGYAFRLDSSSSISLFSGLEYVSSGIGSFIQMSDSVMNIGSTSATDFTSITFSPTRIKFTDVAGTGSVGDVWTNLGSGYGHWAAGGIGAQDLQSVTDIDNKTTNDIIVGARTNSVGAFSVEKTFTALNVHAFDDYSILNPSSGGSGYASFDARTEMTGAVNNDHYIAHQSRLLYNASGNLTGDYGMTGLYVYNQTTGAGTITNAHGIYIRQVGSGGGAITNAYGIRVLPVTEGTNNFGIRCEGGKNSFVDAVMVGGHTTPIAKLDVRNSSFAQSLYCDNTIANGYAGIFNSSNGSGGNICLDLAATGGTGNKGINFASSMTANDWNIYSSGASKTYIAGRVGLNITAPVWGLDVQRTIGGNKDSIDLQSTTAARQMLVIDTTNGKFQRMDLLSPTSNSLAHTLDAQFTTQGNTGTSETDLYSYTVPVNKLGADGRTVNFEIDGEFNDITSTAQMKLYFAGNVTLNTGAVAISATGAWKLGGYIIRTSSTTAHVTYELRSLGLATPLFLGYSNITSLDFTTTNIFKITAQASGAGGSTSDITAHSWQVTYKPAP